MTQSRYHEIAFRSLDCTQAQKFCHRGKITVIHTITHLHICSATAVVRNKSCLTRQNNHNVMTDTTL